MEHIKLIYKGQHLQDPTLVLSSLPIPIKLVLVGTPQHELEKAEEIRSQLRVRVRDDLNGAVVQGGSGRDATRSQHGFQSIETIPGLPEQDKARRILNELANDPGVLHVMKKNNWTVPVLAELYPDGMVGVSDVCVMGLNQNNGQKILLRLRTDDLKVSERVSNMCSQALPITANTSLGLYIK